MTLRQIDAASPLELDRGSFAVCIHVSAGERRDTVEALETLHSVLEHAGRGTHVVVAGPAEDLQRMGTGFQPHAARSTVAGLTVGQDIGGAGVLARAIEAISPARSSARSG